MRTKIVTIIQARMASSRLPGKVLLDIAGQPMLARVVERARRARTVAQTVVATTTDASDDPVERLCAERGYPCFRGSAHDVLDRYYQAARQFGPEIVVRLTADCPVIDPELIDEVVVALLGEEAVSGQWAVDSGQHPSTLYDFAANRLPPPWGRTYPIGLDVEACTFSGLEIAWREARLPHQREHVMPFFYDNPERFRICLVNHEVDLSTYRWTVDTAEDLELLRKVYARFDGGDDFSWLDVLAVFEREPDLAQINAQVQHKDYREVDERRKDLKGL
jgi:spore coat polysaccharide biosynthesis protein SpsF